jgi:lipooligosaccharide transport system permease protein
MAATPAPIRVLEWNIAVYKRLWRANLVTSFVQPLLYLVGIGIGVGSLVNRNASSTDVLGGVTYAQFLAPGLLATTAMMVSSTESTWPVLDGFKWRRYYTAMTSTPIEVADIVLGHLIWLAFRLVIACTAVAAAMAIVPQTRSIGLLLAVPAAVLCGLSVGMPTTAWAATREVDTAFAAFQRFVIIPLFLFAGAFYPVSQLPEWVRWFAYLTPVWHGVELCRGATLNDLSPAAAVGHVAYMAAWTVGGTLAALPIFRRRLLT